jgi:hypothetical protein
MQTQGTWSKVISNLSCWQEHTHIPLQHVHATGTGARIHASRCYALGVRSRIELEGAVLLSQHVLEEPSETSLIAPVAHGRPIRRVHNICCNAMHLS